MSAQFNKETEKLVYFWWRTPIRGAGMSEWEESLRADTPVRQGQLVNNKSENLMYFGSKSNERGRDKRTRMFLSPEHRSAKEDRLRITRVKSWCNSEMKSTTARDEQVRGIPLPGHLFAKEDRFPFTLTSTFYAHAQHVYRNLV